MIHSITPIKVLVKESSLYNNQKNSDRLIEGWWHTIKCVSGKPFICEIYFPHNGASYDKLTFEDFYWKEPKGNTYPNHVLQLWDVFSSDSYVKEKTYFAECSVDVLLKTKEIKQGIYLFTVDWEGYLADVFEEHKSANFIKLENGQIAAQPNNRIRWQLPSITHDDYLEQKIDWQARKEIKSVEVEPKWLLGKSEKWDYSDNK